ncbi:hypothetical protein EV194_101485 [Natronoflexus pectinivorans]|uniref:Uncharacterized protein n=1 Tax=Natronoflexus pectinivorans TaxID=682526 RepID=A0A4R2GNG4_9BACT|nr:hypothetical protein EV194_101485 [Natronoflexus pectinivorans]
MYSNKKAPPENRVNWKPGFGKCLFQQPVFLLWFNRLREGIYSLFVISKSKVGYFIKTAFANGKKHLHNVKNAPNGAFFYKGSTSLTICTYFHLSLANV